MKQRDVQTFPELLTPSSRCHLFVRCQYSFLWGIKFRHQDLCTKDDHWWPVISFPSRRKVCCYVCARVCKCMHACMSLCMCIQLIQLPEFFLAFSYSFLHFLGLQFIIRQHYQFQSSKPLSPPARNLHAQLEFVDTLEMQQPLKAKIFGSLDEFSENRK